jgi:simple sugar transport system substrate-binding protein
MGNKGNIVELEGTVGASAATDRKKGFDDEIAANFKDIKILKSQTGDFTRAKGKEVMESWLKSDKKNINAVYAHNDDMALGAIEAIEEYGLHPGKDILLYLLMLPGKPLTL